MGTRLGGRWLKPEPEQHECRKPYLWGARTGQRWQCQQIVGTTEIPGGDSVGGRECLKVWRVDRDDHGKIWVEDQPPEPDGAMQRFRLVLDEELWYWLTDELDLRTQDQDVSAATLIETIRKRFEIGSTK